MLLRLGEVREELRGSLMGVKLDQSNVQQLAIRHRGALTMATSL